MKTTKEALLGQLPKLPELPDTELKLLFDYIDAALSKYKEGAK